MNRLSKPLNEKTLFKAHCKMFDSLESITVIDLGEWKFVRAKDEVHLVHLCENPRFPLNITTHSAFHLRMCSYCEERLPDDIDGILHTILPDR